MAQLVAMLEDAGRSEVYVDDGGPRGLRLTKDGVRVGNTLALADESDADAVPLASAGRY